MVAQGAGQCTPGLLPARGEPTVVSTGAWPHLIPTGSKASVGTPGHGS